MLVIRTRAPSQRQESEGSALLLSLMAVSTMSVIGMAYIHMAIQGTEETEVMMESIRAERLAEAAITEAITAVSQGFTGDIGSRAGPARLGEGLFWVESEVTGDFTRLVAHAVAGGGTSSQEVSIFTGSSSIDIPALFGRDGVRINGWANIDSYDSSNGSYWTQNPTVDSGHFYLGQSGKIASNGSIDLSNSTHVYGDVMAGPGESVNLGSARVSGVVGNTTSITDLPDIPVPAIPFAGDFAVGRNTVEVLPSGEYGFEELSLKGGSVLVVKGPATLRLEDLNFSPGALLYLDTSGGKVDFHIENDFDVHPSSAIYGYDNDASKILFNYTGSNRIHLLPGSGITGVIYAPDADIWMQPGCQVFGAVLGSMVTMRNGSSLHFDERLLDSDLTAAQAPTFERIVWHKTERHADLLACVSSNPYDALQLDKDDLVSPAEAWSDEFHPQSDQGVWDALADSVGSGNSGNGDVWTYDYEGDGSTGSDVVDTGTTTGSGNGNGNGNGNGKK